MLNAALACNEEAIKLLKRWRSYHGDKIIDLGFFGPHYLDLPKTCKAGISFHIFKMGYPALQPVDLDEFAPRRRDRGRFFNPRQAVEIATTCLVTTRIDIFEEVASVWTEPVLSLDREMREGFQVHVAKALVLACEQGKEDMLRHLLQFGAPVEGLVEIDGRRAANSPSMDAKRLSKR